MVRDDLVVIGEPPAANATFRVLVNDLAVENLSQLGRRSDFPISAWMMWIFNPAHRSPQLAIPWTLLSTAAEPRAMDWANFVQSQLHICNLISVTLRDGFCGSSFLI